MLNRSKNGLEIFDNFQIDYNLPKHKKESNSSYSNGTNVSFATSGGSIFLNPDDFNDSNESFNEIQVKLFFKRIHIFFKNLFKPKPKLSVADFFKAVKSSSIDLVKYTDRVNNYITLLNHAEKNNQQALVNDIKLKIEEAKYESILYSGGFTKVITEEQVVKFYKDCKKGLELTWIRNFIRVIPEVATLKKEEANKLNVFDNFVILFYDPEKKSFKIEEKDPILFGVIKGSRKLYYIADWIDEYCDLTLESFVEKFGDDAIKANDINTNVKL